MSQQSNDWFTLAACDPSLGKQGKRHDYSAIIVLLYDRQNKRYFILDADLKKRKPDRIISDLIEYARLRNLRLVGVESVQFQEYLVTELEKTRDNNNLSFQVKGIKPQSDKIGRIQNLQPFIASGKLQFCRRHRLLLDQFRMFPKGDHDDGPDALEMAIQIADKAVQRQLRVRRLG